MILLHIGLLFELFTHLNPDDVIVVEQSLQLRLLGEVQQSLGHLLVHHALVLVGHHLEAGAEVARNFA